MLLSKKKLEAYLAYQIHGKKSPSPLKKPPQQARIPIPKKRAKPRRGPERSEKYKAWIRTLPSILTGKTPCEACHTGTDGGMRMKASDFSCVPMTRKEHIEYHATSRAAMERKYGVSFAGACAALRAEWEHCNNKTVDRCSHIWDTILMTVVGEDKATKFGKKYATARKPLARFLGIAKAATWKHFAEVKNLFGDSVDYVSTSGVTIFDIGGTKYRLVSVINYELQTLLIEELLTHQQYDERNY